MSEHDRTNRTEGGAGQQDSATKQAGAADKRARVVRQRAQVQRKAKGGGGGARVPQGGGGAPLPENVRARVEPQLGANLADVRVHTGSESAKSAEGFGARAFTVGNDVHFNAGEYAPGSKEGDRLLVHELTHVVQGQSSGVQRKADESAHGGGAEHGDSDGAKADGADAAAHGGGDVAAAHEATDHADGGAGKEAHAPGAAAAVPAEVEHTSNAAEEAAGHADGAVSQPGDPAEKEADKVADHVTEQMHGEGPADGASGDAATAQAAPKIAAKLQNVARKATPGGAAPGGGAQDFQDQEITAYSQALQRIAADPMKADPKALLRTRDRAFELAQKSTSPKGQALRGLALMACDKVDTEWARLIQLRIGAPLGGLNVKDPQVAGNLDKIARAVEAMVSLVGTASHLPQAMSAVQALQTQLTHKRLEVDAAKAKPVPPPVPPKPPLPPGGGGGQGKQTPPVQPQPQAPIAGKLPPPPAPLQPQAQPQAPIAGKLPPPPAPLQPQAQPQAPVAGKLPPPPAPLQPQAHAPDAAHAQPPATPDAPAAEPPIEVFAKALAAGDPKAKELWNQLPVKDRGGITPSEMSKALTTNPELGVEMLRDSHTTFAKHPEFAKQILNAPNVTAFVQPLDQANMVNDLIDAPPLLSSVTNKEAQGLQHFYPVASARRLFEKVYPKLQDASYDSARFTSGVWASGEIEKLFGILAKWAPVAHVHASSEGFWQAVQVDWNKTNEWKAATFAWQEGRKMVLPKTGGGDYKQFENWKGHNMTGGGGASPQGAAKDAEQKKPGAATGHFEGSVLHEVGHAVANAVGGNAWSMTRNNWEKVDMATFAKALFPDGADKKLKKGIIFKKLEKDAVSAVDARTFIASRMTAGTWLPTGRKAPEVLEFIEKNYADQPLYHYWKALEGKVDDYKIPDSNVAGGKAYAKLSRFDNAFCRYDAKTFQNRVSWYSVASPAEWFAEQYSHYFRTGGAGLEGDVKQKMDEIAKMKFDPASMGKDGSQGALSGADSGGAGAAGPGAGGKIKPEEAGGDGGAGATGEKKDQKPPENIERLGFPW